MAVCAKHELTDRDAEEAAGIGAGGAKCEIAGVLAELRERMMKATPEQRAYCIIKAFSEMRRVLPPKEDLDGDPGKLRMDAGYQEHFYVWLTAPYNKKAVSYALYRLFCEEMGEYGEPIPGSDTGRLSHDHDWVTCFT